MAIINISPGGGGVNSPYAWIEYGISVSYPTDYSKLIINNYGNATGTITSFDASASNEGGFILTFYSDIKSYGTGIRGEGYLHEWQIGFGTGGIPNYTGWCINEPHLETAYYVTKILSYNQNNWPTTVDIQYSKKAYYGTKYTESINTSNVIKVHLTEKNGNQYKKVPLES